MHVIVIGTGIVGSSVAYECAKAGAKVTVFDAGRIGGGASSVSFAWTNATGKSPRSYFDLNVAGMRAHMELKRDFGTTPWFTQTGGFEWRTTPEGRMRLLDEGKMLKEWGYAIEWLDPNRVAEMEPDIDIAAIGNHPIAYFPEEGWIDPVLYSGWLLRTAKQRWNTEVHEHTRITDIESHGGRAVAVRSAAGERYQADAIINCAGGWATEALGDAPALPMTSTIGILAFTPPVALTLRSHFHIDDLDVRPDGAGRLMMHKVSVDRMLTKIEKLRPDGPEATALIEATRAAIPALKSVEVEAVRTAVRPVTADGLTCAGESPHLAGYYVAVTHSGVTIGPYLGKAMADEVVRGKQHEALNDFRLSRFLPPKNTRKVAAAINA